MPDDPDPTTSDQDLKDLKDPTADKSWLELENVRSGDALGLEERPLAGPGE